LDLRTIFDYEEKTVYHDWIHVNHLRDYEIAEKIFDYVLPIVEKEILLKVEN